MINRHQIESLLRYRFSNGTLLEQAFIRSSFANCKHIQGNEMLEFLGDRVLDLIVLEDLLEKNGACIDKNNQYHVDITEGEATKDKIKKVDETYLSNVVTILGLNEFLIIDDTDTNNSVEDEDSVKADLFEAIIGAIYIDSKKNIDITRKVIMQLFEQAEQNCPEGMSLNEEDYPSVMNEWQFRLTGTYLIHTEEKKDDFYVSTITIDKGNLTIPISVFTGTGKNKKQAFKNASKEAYEFLYPHFWNVSKLQSIKAILDDLDNDNCITQLNILADKKIVKKPVYDYLSADKGRGIEVWTCTCSIEGYNTCSSNEFNSKKEAKKDAAWKMINEILKLEEVKEN